MRPVTGNKTPRTANKVSIRRTSDGHSFSFPPLENHKPEESETPVEIELLTPGTLLVPAAAFAPEKAAALLAAAGITVGENDRIVTSDSTAPAIALMTLDEPTARRIEPLFGSRARYTTPLLHELKIEGPTVWMRHTPELLYIKVYDDGLQFAEVIAISDPTDTEYLFERLNAVFPLAQFTLRYTGDTDRALDKRLRNRFKKTICE